MRRAGFPGSGKIRLTMAILHGFLRRVRWMEGRRRAAGFGVFLALGMATPAAAEIFLYRDPRGAIQFSSAPAAPKARPVRWETVSWKPVRWTKRERTWIDPARRTAYDHLIRDAASRHNVDVALVKAVIRAESDFVPNAVSPAGALGLMQLMPGTARLRGVRQAFEARDNIEGGVKHLRYLLDRYRGNLTLTLAAYNAGEGAVDRAGGVPRYAETRQYLARVLRFRDRYLQETVSD